MENNCYIPKLEEFHYGFEYWYKSSRTHGYLDNTNGDWVKTEFTGGDIEDEASEVDCIITSIEDNNPEIQIMVKRLCADDFIGHNFKKLGVDSYGDEVFEFKQETAFNTGINWLFRLSTNKVRIFVSRTTYGCFDYGNGNFKNLIFDINNKSELKKLLKQLSII